MREHGRRPHSLVGRTVCRSARVALVVAAAALLAALAHPAATDAPPAGGDFAALYDAGDYAAAYDAGKPLFQALKARYPHLPAVEIAEMRLQALESARGLAAYKFHAAAGDARAETPSPFLYVSPAPREFLAQLRDDLIASRPFYSGLSDDDAAFLAAWLRSAPASVAADGVEAYLAVAAAGASDERLALIRPYLSALVLAMHDEETLPAAAAMLSEKVSDGAPALFLAADAATSLGDRRAAMSAIEAVEKASGAAEPSPEMLRILKEIARAAEADGELDRAAAALARVASSRDDGAEDALRAVIRIHAEKTRNFQAAAEACRQFLDRFPHSPHAANMEYFAALYQYQAGSFDACIKAIEALKIKHPSSNLTPNILILDGLACTATNRPDDALKAYADLLARYPQHGLAAKAQFLVGFTHLSSQRYPEAREAFQRLVDFYPNDSYAEQARRYIETLSRLPGQQGAPAAGSGRR